MIKSKKSTKSLHPSTYYGDRAAGRERGGLKTVFLADTMEKRAASRKRGRHNTVVLKMLWRKSGL